MARLGLDDPALRLAITGLDRLLGLKGELVVPLAHVRGGAARPRHVSASTACAWGATSRGW